MSVLIQAPEWLQQQWTLFFVTSSVRVQDNTKSSTIFSGSTSG